MQFGFYILFYLTFLITFNLFVLVATEDQWPYCGNFAWAKGYPAGCATTVDDLCVYQDDACAAMFCDFAGLQIGYKFKPCNEECAKSSTPIVEIGNYECHCMQENVQICPNRASIRSSLQRYIPQGDNYTLSRKLGKISPLWGARIIMPEINVIPVYCSDKKDTCGLTNSLCEQGSCLPGQCHYKERCYYVKSVINLSPPMLTSVCSPGKLVAVEDGEEKEFIFQLLLQTYDEGSQQQLLTSGMVPSQSTDGVWDGWSANIGADVVSLIEGLSPEEADRFLEIVTRQTEEPLWSLVTSANLPQKVMCEMLLEDATTLEEQCDSDYTTSTMETTLNYEISTNYYPVYTDTTLKNSDTTINGESLTTSSTIKYTFHTATDTKTTVDDVSNEPECTTSTNDYTHDESTDIYTNYVTDKFTEISTVIDLTTSQNDPTYDHYNSSPSTQSPTFQNNNTVTSTHSITTTLAINSSISELVTSSTASSTNFTEENCDSTTVDPTTAEETVTTEEEEEDCETTTEEITTEEECDTTTELASTESDYEDCDTTTPEETTFTEETTTIPTEQCQPTCIQKDQYGEEWECCSNTACSKDCPMEALGKAYWVCGNFTNVTDHNNFTTSFPDYSNCHNTWLQNLTDQIEENKIKSWDVIQELEYYISDSALFGHEMPSVLLFINTSMTLLKDEQGNETAVTQLNQRKFMAENSMRTIDRLFDLDKQWEQLKEFEQTQVGMQMQSVTDWIGFAVTAAARKVNRPFNMSSQWTTTLMEAQFVQHHPGNSSGPVLKFPLSKSGSSIELREIPKVFQGQQIVIEAVGTTLPIAPAEMIFPARLNSLGALKKQLNSEIVTLSLVGPGRRALTHFSSPDAIIVTLMHEYDAKRPGDPEVHRALYPGEKPTAVQGSERCVFWNSSLSNNGQWDTRGCYIVSHTRSETVCACNHLSSFALIMDMHNYIDKDPVMEVLGIVCSSASIVCLLLTLIVLHFLRGIQGERNSIGKHVCLCLVLGHFLSLILLDQSFLHLPHEVCIGVGVVLHYVFLAAFMWMAVEGHHLYRLVVRVFDSGRDLSRVYLLVAYGTPAIIVGVTGIIALVTHDAVYGNDDLCWLSSPNYIWAFLGPAAVITTLNFLVLIQALRVAVTAGGSQKKSFMERVRIWIRGWFALSALLGVTWLFGFLYMEIYYNLAYIFIVLIGLQGVFIFMSRVVFNEQVKSAFKRSVKQRAMISRFYSLAWKGRSSDSSMQQSSWFLAGSSSSQLDLASSSSSSYWAHTPSRRRSSATNQPDAFTDPDGYTTLPANFLHQNMAAGVQSDKASNTWQFIKRKHGKEEEASELPPYSVQSNEIQQAWSSCREQEVLSEIAEEDEDQGPEKWNKF